MLAQHTAEELELWSQIKEQVLRKINQSSIESEIQHQEVNGQFFLTHKTTLRRVVFSFSSPAPMMYVHLEDDNAPARSPITLGVQGNRLVNAASDSNVTVDNLVTTVLSFLQSGK